MIEREVAHLAAGDGRRAPLEEARPVGPDVELRLAGTAAEAVDLEPFLGLERAVEDRVAGGRETEQRVERGAAAQRQAGVVRRLRDVEVAGQPAAHEDAARSQADRPLAAHRADRADGLADREVEPRQGERDPRRHVVEPLLGHAGGAEDDRRGLDVGDERVAGDRGDLEPLDVEDEAARRGDVVDRAAVHLQRAELLEDPSVEERLVAARGRPARIAQVEVESLGLDPLDPQVAAEQFGQREIDDRAAQREAPQRPSLRPPLDVLHLHPAVERPQREPPDPRRSAELRLERPLQLRADQLRAGRLEGEGRTRRADRARHGGERGDQEARAPRAGHAGRRSTRSPLR